MAMAQGRGGKPGAASTYSLGSIALPGSTREEELLDAEGVRADGREVDESRPLFLKTGFVARAEGSAFGEAGSTKVLVSVFGPRESRRAQSFSGSGRLNCDVKIAAFATPVRGKFGQGSLERELAGMLQKSLEAAVILTSFPKAVVDVFVLVLQMGGGALPLAVTTASLALADAGVELRDLVACAAAARVGEALLLDPSAEEERRADGTCVAALLPSRRQVTQLAMTGAWPGQSATEAFELCLTSCEKLDELQRATLVEDLEAKSAPEEGVAAVAGELEGP